VSGYERVLRPVLFRAFGGDAERVHGAVLRALPLLPSRALAARLPRRPRTVFGVRFPNPVGLAAGLDKDGVALRAWPALGFGFVEVGTVTRHPQPGNPRPRLFRLPASGALVNRMGFNNAGAAALAARLAAYGPLPVPLGISLGKSKLTPLPEAVGDYLASLRELRRFADYVAVNVSSPNTPGLRGLQDAAHLRELLAALREAARGTPLLVKIAPDLTEPAVGELLAVCAEHGVAGIIATNTTVSRPAGLSAEPGGLSGTPLFGLAHRMVKFVHAETAGTLPVIAVGGIGSVADAAAMFDAGASLVQLYTGFIYRGPALVRAITEGVTPDG
jgi:dihydroorotate dehydrogenase